MDDYPPKKFNYHLRRIIKGTLHKRVFMKSRLVKPLIAKQLISSHSILKSPRSFYNDKKNPSWIRVHSNHNNPKVFVHINFLKCYLLKFQVRSINNPCRFFKIFLLKIRYLRKKITILKYIISIFEINN